MKAKCCYCGKRFEIFTGNYNRAMKLGLNVYCNQKCAGLGRRTNETPEEKKAIKYWYDAFLHISMTEEDRELDELQRMVYFQWEYTNNPEKHRRKRKERMPAHIEYCRQPAYKEKKKNYDEQYRAKQNYGDYWEAAIVLKKLEKEIDVRAAKKENKIYIKSTTQRKRLWQKLLKQVTSLPPRI